MGGIWLKYAWTGTGTAARDATDLPLPKLWSLTVLRILLRPFCFRCYSLSRSGGMIAMTGASVRWEEALTPAAKRVNSHSSRASECQGEWESEISMITLYCQWRHSEELIAWRPSPLKKSNELSEPRSEVDEAGDMMGNGWRNRYPQPYNVLQRADSDVC